MRYIEVGLNVGIWKCLEERPSPKSQKIASWITSFDKMPGSSGDTSQIVPTSRRLKPRNRCMSQGWWVKVNRRCKVNEGQEMTRQTFRDCEWQLGNGCERCKMITIFLGLKEILQNAEIGSRSTDSTREPGRPNCCGRLLSKLLPMRRCHLPQGKCLKNWTTMQNL